MLTAQVVLLSIAAAGGLAFVLGIAMLVWGKR